MTFESQFPPDFRKEDIENVLRFVTAGKFAQLICLPGNGKATLLRLLAKNQNIRKLHLGAKEKSTRFIYINMLELEKYDQASVDEFLLHATDPKIKRSADPITLSKQLKDTVGGLTQNLTLVLLFDHFDEFQNHLFRSFFQRLRTLKNESRYKFACVFATRRDLRQLVDQEIIREFYDFFVGNSVYMRLYDKKAIETMLSQIEKVFGKKLSAEQKINIINLTSGHTKLTRLCAETILQENLSLEIESFITKPIVRSTIFELWLFLTAQEQHTLIQIVTKNPVSQNESVENLLNFGLLKEAGLPSHHPTIPQPNNLLFTIPLFEAFIRTNASTLHREKISYNPNTNEITKGEEIISGLLSPQENRLLKFLIENQGKIIDREEIIKAAWPEALQAEGISDEAIDQMMFRLRKKIEDEPNNPKHILTVKGLGFRFQP